MAYLSPSSLRLRARARRTGQAYFALACCAAFAVAAS